MYACMHVSMHVYITCNYSIILFASIKELHHIWIISGVVVIIIVLGMTTIFGSVILGRYCKRVKKECHEVELFEMTQNPVYENSIHTISNSAYGQFLKQL